MEGLDTTQKSRLDVPEKKSTNKKFEMKYAWCLGSVFLVLLLGIFVFWLCLKNVFEEHKKKRRNIGQNHRIICIFVIFSLFTSKAKQQQPQHFHQNPYFLRLKQWFVNVDVLVLFNEVRCRRVCFNIHSYVSSF
jgi:hypothetical protein